MKSLLSVYEKYKNLTDKNTGHSYISNVYEKLLHDTQDTCLNVLEIGIDKYGSIKLWHEYFSNPTYLNLVESKFGSQSRLNLEDMAKIKLKRKLLGD